MTRRFPTPLLGIDRIGEWAPTAVTVAVEAGEPLEKSAFVDRLRKRLRKPDSGDRYSESYVRRILSSYIQLGVLRQESDRHVTTWQFGRSFHGGEIDLKTFLWYGIKRSWVIAGEFPEGIDGLRTIHRILATADEPHDGTGLQRKLASDYDYEFNDGGIRGYPELLCELGAANRRTDGYVATQPVDRWRDRFRNVDLLSAFERWLKREGPQVDPPSDRVKRDLVKYYIYRESNGLGKHRQLFDTFRRDYLDESAYRTDSAEPTIRRDGKYVEPERRRRALRDEICSQFPTVDKESLAGLSRTVLERIVDASSPEAAKRIAATDSPGLSRADVEGWQSDDRPDYTFSDTFNLYRWQREAADEWFDPSSGDHDPQTGIARVVTGAGKTVMALEVVRRWLAKHPDGVVTVVVPTNVLMRQWLQELVETLNVPPSEVGWAGGGHKDEFADDYRVLVSIVNSAVKDDFLGDALEAADVDDHLLITDECHRYTSDTFSTVFDYPRTASLGLSATPLSEPGSDDRSPEDELLLNELGSIFYDLTYSEAIDQRLIPEFRVRYVGFDLTDAERQTYERLTEAVVEAVSEIELQYGNRLHRLDGGFAQKLQAIAEAAEGPTPAIADFFQYTQQRRELVADAIGRQAITLALLRETVQTEKKSIVFQERIDQLQRMVAPAESRGRNPRTGTVTEGSDGRSQLYDQYPGLKTVDRHLEELFMTADYRPVMYHSGHRRATWNDFAVEWFGDDGFANVMLSVKALIEGVDVPSADVGIVRVSSGSVRQRIQTLGRVLRTGEDPEEPSDMYVLYARDTVDENIFRDYDWDDQLSMADVEHYVWDPDGDWTTGDWDEIPSFWESVREADQTERPQPSSERPTPDADDLSRGDLYPGPREGYRFSVDSDGRPVTKEADGRRRIRHDTAAAIASFVHQQKGGGTVIVNDANHAVTKIDDEYVFLGVVDPEEFRLEETSGLTDRPDDTDLEDLV